MLLRNCEKPEWYSLLIHRLENGILGFSDDIKARFLVDH